MTLMIIRDELAERLEIPEDWVREAEAFFAKMDQDMDRGWQMGPTWVEKPDRVQRCQIAADKLLTAQEQENPRMAQLMGGYILARMPGVKEVYLDTQGEMLETRFE